MQKEKRLAPNQARISLLQWTIHLAPRQKSTSLRARWVVPSMNSKRTYACQNFLVLVILCMITLHVFAQYWVMLCSGFYKICRWSEWWDSRGRLQRESKKVCPIISLFVIHTTCKCISNIYIVEITRVEKWLLKRKAGDSVKDYRSRGTEEVLAFQTSFSVWLCCILHSVIIYAMLSIVINKRVFSLFFQRKVLVRPGWNFKCTHSGTFLSFE